MTTDRTVIRKYPGETFALEGKVYQIMPDPRPNTTSHCEACDLINHLCVASTNHYDCYVPSHGYTVAIEDTPEGLARYVAKKLETP